MDEILTLEDLKKALTLEGVTNYEEAFKKIADALFNRFAIRNKNHYYMFVDIEFYHSKTDEQKDDKKKMLTYERETDAGEWFMHDSGVDITFKSDGKECYGGILIRGIREILCEKGNAKYKFTNGPKKVMWEIFDRINAFNPECYPTIVKLPNSEKNFEPTRMKRVNAKSWSGIDRAKEFRFTIPKDLWDDHKNYSAYPF